MKHKTKREWITAIKEIYALGNGSHKDKLFLVRHFLTENQLPGVEIVDDYPLPHCATVYIDGHVKYYLQTGDKK